MSSLDDRKEAYENKFAHDAEFRFKVEARACKLFGLWMAGQLGLNDQDAAEYAKAIVSANVEEEGFDDVKRKVRPDIDAKGLSISDHMIDKMLEQYMQEAKEQLA